MTQFNYALNRTNYSWENALLWGNCVEHCKKATEGSVGDGIVHLLIAAVEFIPIIGQIASIFEKLIVDNFSSSTPTAPPLTTRRIYPETAHRNIPTPHTLHNTPLKKDMASLSAQLPQNIESQQEHKTYKREKLVTLSERNRNLPIPLASLPRKMSSFSKNATFYAWSAEGIHDYGWGCAWRMIQTCLSIYKIIPSFEELFHLFGPSENLKIIYENKYPTKELPSVKFAPYDSGDGWAEPFIGHMVMHFYGISSALETVNGIPSSSSSPHAVFHNASLGFATFKNRLEAHFTTENPAPVMIDDGIYSLSIVGIDREDSNTILWMADPHINDGINKRIDGEKSPTGLYTVTLNGAGKQIDCSLIHQDSHQVPNMYNSRTYEGLHFDSKHWMVLFPLAKS